MNGYEQPADRAVRITNLLDAVNSGNREAETCLLSAVYDELRVVAARHMARERGNHTLQPTALVNEVYLRLLQQRNLPWQNRAHFFAVAARMMRRVLVDHARTRNADKRGGDFHPVALDEIRSDVGRESKSPDLAALDEALERLEQIDPRQTRIVELRFFGGLSTEEIAFALNVSTRTVKRDWRSARAWLYGEIAKRPVLP